MKPGIAGEEARMAEDITKTLNRWKSIEGHARGVEKMIEEDAYCVDILKQTLAIQGAIEKVNGAILERHLNSCVTTAIQGDDPAERERVLAELMDVFRGSGHLKRMAAVGEVLGDLADSLAAGNGTGSEKGEAI